MGSPLSPVVANIFMENFQNIAITTSRRPPKIWKRYVDDTFVILSKYAARSFLLHVNNINEAIQFTVYSENENGELPLLDCLIMRNPCQDCTTVYIGETSGSVTDRMKEHSRLTKRHPKNNEERTKLERSSAIPLRVLGTEHHVDFDNPKILS